jgi:hypothetical protein
MRLIINLGDLAVLAPASIGLIAFLFWMGARRRSCGWRRR